MSAKPFVPAACEWRRRGSFTQPAAVLLIVSPRGRVEAKVACRGTTDAPITISMGRFVRTLVFPAGLATLLGVAGSHPLLRLRASAITQQERRTSYKSGQPGAGLLHGEGGREGKRNRCIMLMPRCRAAAFPRLATGRCL